MICVDMTFENILYVQFVLGAVLNDGLVVCVGGTAGRGVVVENGIEDECGGCGGAGDDVGHCGGVFVEEAVDRGRGRGWS